MNYRRIIAAFLAAACLSFAACDDKKAEGEATTQAGGTAAEQGDTAEGTFSDLHKVVDNVKGFYGENVEFIFTEDEYSDEVLMFTYGLMEDKFVEAVESYVLTECDGMSADTFAIITFKDGTDKALIEEAASVMEAEYVEGLKSKLAAYNPEEFAASDGYKLKIYDDSVMMVISSEHTNDILTAVGK